VAAGEVYRELGEAAWAWVLGQVREDDGPWLPEVIPDDAPPAGPDEDRDSLYAGIAGLAPVLAELGQHRALSDSEQALATGIVTRLSAMARTRAEPSLYSGLGGDVTALKLLAPGREQVALGQLADLITPAGWPTTLRVVPGSTAPLTDLVLGTAGVVLAAIWAGGEHSRKIAATGGESLLPAAEQTADGLDWGIWPGAPSRMPNYSHGTAGVATALAVAGAALGRDDFIAAARHGAQHLLAIGSLDDDRFVVPHTLPSSTWHVDPVTYTWCHGSAGTSHLFAALAEAGVDTVAGHEVTGLRQRCLHAILAAGVPQRLRPGFWDNDGRCCGTAGVGDILLDAAQDATGQAAGPGQARPGPDHRPDSTLLRAACTMADALVDRAIRDQAGARWRFLEHRQEPPLLPPGTAWMQGAAGIAGFLLRLARVMNDGLGAPVVDRPDQWWAVPARLRTAHTQPVTIGHTR
jgi:Lanthionine synthetase C-like protein